MDIQGPRPHPGSDLPGPCLGGVFSKPPQESQLNGNQVPPPPAPAGLQSSSRLYLISSAGILVCGLPLHRAGWARTPWGTTINPLAHASRRVEG